MSCCVRCRAALEQIRDLVREAEHENRDLTETDAPWRHGDAAVPTWLLWPILDHALTEEPLEP